MFKVYKLGKLAFIKVKNFFKVKAPRWTEKFLGKFKISKKEDVPGKNHSKINSFTEPTQV